MYSYNYITMYIAGIIAIRHSDDRLTFSAKVYTCHLLFLISRARRNLATSMPSSERNNRKEISASNYIGLINGSDDPLLWRTRR